MLLQVTPYVCQQQASQGIIFMENQDHTTFRVWINFNPSSLCPMKEEKALRNKELGSNLGPPAKWQLLKPLDHDTWMHFIVRLHFYRAMRWAFECCLGFISYQNTQLIQRIKLHFQMLKWGLFLHKTKLFKSFLDHEWMFEWAKKLLKLISIKRIKREKKGTTKKVLTRMS